MCSTAMNTMSKAFRPSFRALSDPGRGIITSSASKMNGDIKQPVFKRGASVQLLTSMRQDVSKMDDSLYYHQLSFAESFTTSASARSAKNLQGIPENQEELITAAKIIETVDELIRLKDKSISSLTIERLTKKFIEQYENVDDKDEVLVYLATNLKINEAALKEKAREVCNVDDPDPEQLTKAELQLRNVLDPPYNWLYTRVAQVSQQGVKFLSDLRADALNILASKKALTNEHRLALKAMSGHLKDLLAHWFSAGLLDLEQITWQSPCAMLQKVSDYEAVHPVRNWTDLKARVGPYRRCFVLTHRCMPGEPIVVLHVALTTEISSSIGSVVKHHRKVKKTSSMDEEATDCDNIKGSAGIEDPAFCTTAIFYSITSTQTGLQGIELGNSLIKQAVKKLREEFPNMSQFSTLSPIPGFRIWLLRSLQMSMKDISIPELLTSDEKEKILSSFYGPTDDFYDSLCTAFKSNQWAQNEKLRDALEPVLMRLCAHYLFVEKRRKFALDPVANFHLRNGATMWRLNWWADLSPRGLTNSCGIMVNYRYYLDKLEANSCQYQENATIDASEQIRQLSKQSHTTTSNESKL